LFVSAGGGRAGGVGGWVSGWWRRDEVVCLVFASVEGMGEVREVDGVVEEGLGRLVKTGSCSWMVWLRGWGKPSCCNAYLVRRTIVVASNGRELYLDGRRRAIVGWTPRKPAFFTPRRKKSTSAPPKANTRRITREDLNPINWCSSQIIATFVKFSNFPTLRKSRILDSRSLSRLLKNSSFRSMSEITHPTIKGTEPLASSNHFVTTRITQAYILQMAGSAKSPTCGRARP